jgi:hypothetical protein
LERLKKIVAARTHALKTQHDADAANVPLHDQGIAAEISELQPGAYPKSDVGRQPPRLSFRQIPLRAALSSLLFIDISLQRSGNAKANISHTRVF